MKKRIIASIMMCLVVFSCIALPVTATTKTGKLHKHDKWTYSTSVCTGNYKSTYNDCTSKKYCSEVVWAIADGVKHYTKVTNKQKGTTSGWCGASAGCNAKATVKANWFGKNGTASIKCNLSY